MGAPPGNQYAKGHGRPEKYKPEFVQQAANLCAQGATDIELADFFEVDATTIYSWKARHPEFSQALKVGKEVADDRVERSLYARANGFSFDTVKIFNADGAPMVVPYREVLPPDTAACIFWLKNRRGKEWRDRNVLEHSGPDGGPIETLDTTKVSVHDLSRIVGALEQNDAAPLKIAAPITNGNGNGKH